MNKDELRQYLRESLSVTVERDPDYYGHADLIVQIKLENEVISTSVCSL